MRHQFLTNLITAITLIMLGISVIKLTTRVIALEQHQQKPSPRVVLK